MRNAAQLDFWFLMRPTLWFVLATNVLIFHGRRPFEGQRPCNNDLYLETNIIKISLLF